MTDDLGFTLVSFAHLIHTGDGDDDEPYMHLGFISSNDLLCRRIT